MPYPQDYTREFGFASFQETHPQSPLPGDQVDVELDAVGKSTDALISFLKKFTRSDGRLANGSVGVDQLAADLSIGFKAPTTWESGVQYSLSDTVFYLSGFYNCDVPHVSGDVFQPEYWTLVFDLGYGALLGTVMAAAGFFTRPVASIITALPGSPIDGERHLVAHSGTTGALVGKEDQVVQYSNGAWGYSGTPPDGQQTYVQSVQRRYRYLASGSQWKQQNSKLVFSSEFASLSAANTFANGASMRLVVDEDVTLAANTAITAPTLGFAGGVITLGAYNLDLTATRVIADAADQLFVAASSGAVTLPPICRASICWWGAKGDSGTTDNKVPIRAALAASAYRTLYIPGAGTGYYEVSDDLPLVSGVNIVGDGASSEIRSTKLDANIFIGSAVTKVNFYKIKVKYAAKSGTLTTANIAGIQFAASSTFCRIEDCEFDGMTYAGAYLNDSSDHWIENNYFHDFQQTTAGDPGDIKVLRNACRNIITKNKCSGGAYSAHGIIIQDPYETTLPYGNTVSFNYVGTHYSYGIVASYLPNFTNIDTKVVGNTVEDIIGTGNSGSAGMGIYVANGGGVIVSNNTVNNCCISTSDSTNFPCAISLTYTTDVYDAPLISGNKVNAPKWCGIGLSGTKGTISNNTVKFSDGTNGNGIKVVDATDVAIIGNEITANGSITTACIAVVASGADLEGITITGNTVRGSSGMMLALAGTGGKFVKNSTINGNSLISPAGAGIGLSLSNAKVISAFGNTIIGDTGIALGNVTSARFSGGSVRGATTTVQDNAGNTKVFFGASVDLDMDNPGRINCSAGIIIEQQADGTPSSGSWVRGSRVWYNSPSAGAAPGSVCTTSGSPGTWKDMAALAA